MRVVNMRSFSSILFDSKNNLVVVTNVQNKMAKEYCDADK